MCEGWVTVDGETYYLAQGSGTMVTGSCWIDGYLRSFNSIGACLKTGYRVKWKNGSSRFLVGSTVCRQLSREFEPSQPEENCRREVPDVPEPPDACLIDWTTEFASSRNPLVALAENQLRTPSLSSRMLLAATFLLGMFERIIQENARSSLMAAPPSSGTNGWSAPSRPSRTPASWAGARRRAMPSWPPGAR